MCLTLSQSINDLNKFNAITIFEDTNCCSLLPPGGATVEKEEEKFREIARVKKKTDKKKKLMNFDDSANDELEFEK